MPKETTAKATKTVKYVALRNCLYNNRWTPRGTIIELPEDTKFVHACFEMVNENNTVFISAKEKGVFYDPMKEAIDKKKVDEVMAGVYRNN